MLRNETDVTIVKTIAHVIDGRGDEPLLGKIPLELDEDTFRFLSSHATKSLKASNNSVGEFLVEGTAVHTALRNLEASDAKGFVGESQSIARHLFKVIKNTLGALSGDLIVMELVVSGKKAYGLLFMEYGTTYTHEVTVDGGELDVVIRPYSVSLPSSTRKLSRFAFYQNGELLMNEACNSDENGEKVEYFISDFLQATTTTDDLDTGIIFREASERWIRRDCKQDIGRAIDTRRDIDDLYINQPEIIISEVVNDMIDSIEEREKFTLNLEKAGIDTEVPFKVDKKWVGEKFKTKKLITDTGFKVQGDFDIFEDSSRFEVQYNGDGTVNLIFKQVRNIHQK